MSGQSPSSGVYRKQRSWLRRIAPKAIIVLLALVALTAVGLMPAKKTEVPATEAPPVNVSVMTIVAEPELPDTFDLPAVVEPNRIVTVAAEVDGRVHGIGPQEGCTVQAGDLLVQLNTDLIEPQVEIAKAQYERDRIQYKRMAALIETDATTRNDYDDATTKLATSEAQLKAILARLERTHIVSPITGVLNRLAVEEGEYVQPGVSVAEVVEIDTVKVVVEVPERDISFFSVGQQAKVLAAVRDREHILEGTITFISEVADALTRCTRLEITTDNRQGLLRSGQIVRARLMRRVLENVIMIPLLAVIPMEDGRAVYVVNAQQQAQRRQVKLDVIKGDRVQVTDGLAPGDRLIVAGHRFVAPGQTVNVIAPKGKEGEPSL